MPHLPIHIFDILTSPLSPIKYMKQLSTHKETLITAHFSTAPMTSQAALH